MEENGSKCEYLVDGQRCRSIVEGIEGRRVRERSCTNQLKDSCCYLCDSKAACEVSCTYLDKPEDVSPSDSRGSSDIDREIKACTSRLEEVSALFSEGKIGKQTYVTTSRALENRLEYLTKLKENPAASSQALRVQPTVSRAPTMSQTLMHEQPTLLWYLVPLFFGIIGGIVGYVGTKDQDEDMARSLLLFGILWSLILFFIAMVIWASIMSRYRFF